MINVYFLFRLKYKHRYQHYTVVFPFPMAGEPVSK